MNLAAALAALVNVTSMLSTLTQQAAQISAMIQKAQAEGRTEFTPEEWAVITGGDDAARHVLAEIVSAALKQ